jgi:hypothetical protein
VAVKKSSTGKKTKAERGGAGSATVIHQIGSLLHTMRSIQLHEQELCTLKHHFERESSLNPEVLEELRELLGSMPTRDYLDDLMALQETVGHSS